jgi:hypothetical protein
MSYHNLHMANSILESLHFAVKNSIDHLPYQYIEMKFDPYPGLGLSVVVHCRAKHSESISDVLRHGVFYDKYDYRFNSVSRQISDDPDSIVYVQGYPNFQHNRK